MYVLLTDNEDGSARATVVTDSAEHRFSVSVAKARAAIEYEESQVGRSGVRVSKPESEIWRFLAQSDELTEWIESYELDGVTLKRHA